MANEVTEKRVVGWVMHEPNKLSREEIDRLGDDIADFLSKANPNWPRATLVSMVHSRPGVSV